MELKTSPVRRRGPSWIELSVALTALVVSIVSLFIARRQTEVMDRQLAASVWPAIQYHTSNLRGGDPVITMSVENVGIGPARVRSFSVSHQGVEVGTLTEFVRDCCASDGAAFRTITSFVEGSIIPAGKEVVFFTLPADPQHPEIFEAFDRARGALEVRVCFCSVLEDCWMTTSRRETEAVASCANEQRRRRSAT